jgi:23S rRNA-/tRNA-specific pseudouridylate synthase
MFDIAGMVDRSPYVGIFLLLILGGIGLPFPEVGEWKVIADPTAPSKPNVLAQLGKNSVSTFNVILITDKNYKDVELSVNIKAITGKEDQVRSFYNRLGTKQGRQQF